MSELIHEIKNIWNGIYNIMKIPFRGWHIKKTLNFSNFFKLLFLYVISIIWVILFNVDLSKDFLNKAWHGNFSERRLSIYSVTQRIGEGMLYDRMIEYARENNYDYTGVKFPEFLTKYSVTAHFFYVATSLLNYILQPNFNLALTHHVTVLPYGFNITYLNMPRDSLFTGEGKFPSYWPHLNDYDAYADLYTLSNGKNELLEKIVDNKPVIPAYLAQRKIPYKEVEFDKVLITGSLWGCGRGSLRLKLALKKLVEEDDLLVAIGLEELKFLGKGYLGKMEKFDNNVDDALIKQTQKFGISLISHNQEHMLDGIPTNRIVEAVGASSMTITDRNRFIEKYFADTVLFYDVSANEETIYQQIKNHILWIKENPEKAKAMAKQANRVFNDNFSIEVQMENLFKSQFWKKD